MFHRQHRLPYEERVHAIPHIRENKLTRSVATRNDVSVGCGREEGRSGCESNRIRPVAWRRDSSSLTLLRALTTITAAIIGYFCRCDCCIALTSQQPSYRKDPPRTAGIITMQYSIGFSDEWLSLQPDVPLVERLVAKDSTFTSFAVLYQIHRRRGMRRRFQAPVISCHQMVFRNQDSAK